MRRRPEKRPNSPATAVVALAVTVSLFLAVAAAVEQCSNMAASQSNTITIVELSDNASGDEKADDRSITMDQYRELLYDTGQVDCPLLARLGYPVILVHTNPGQKSIPAAQMVAVGNNHNNRMATVAASRASTGLAVGCVVGNVYALRTDGKDLTAKEWYVLFDMLMNLMDIYGDGEGVSEVQFKNLKGRVRRQMRDKGLLKSSGEGSGAHCWGCGVEANAEVSLLTCSRCKNARYCSKECQRDHWRGGHKEECTPRQTPQQAEASQEQALMESAVLKPEQIIQRSAPVPPLPPPNRRPPDFDDLTEIIPTADDVAIFVFNKDPTNKERYCVICRTRYRLLDPAPDDQCAREQALSGICSYRCWCAANPPGSPYAAAAWYGQQAMDPNEHGVVQVFPRRKR